jgi:hypothetical protein
MVTTYYVSAGGKDGKDGKSEASSFGSIQKAVDLVKPGDTVLIMDGEYTTPYSQIINLENKNGTKEAPITIAAYPKHKPVLKAQKHNWDAIAIKGCSHIIIDGFILKGFRDEINLDYAKSQQSNLNNTATNCNGITVSKKSHHIVIKNNNVSKFPGGGIGTTQIDYISVENNVVSGCGWYSAFGVQGITMLNLWNYDGNTTDYRIIIRGNTCFDNKQLVPSKETGKIQEGHGIMIDRASINNQPYTGKVLITNNVLYSNGGAGIQLFKGECPVEICCNTTYKNSQTLETSELFINNFKNVHVHNNVFYARDGKPALLIAGAKESIVCDNNCACGVFKPPAGAGNMLDVDPKFADVANHNFRLQPGTPAIIGNVKLGFEG